jgi:hypothetical protein
LQGTTWDLSATPLLDTVERLSEMEGVAQASLHGDLAHVIVKANGGSPQSITERLAGFGIQVTGVEPVEPTLEDVFLLLSRQ